MITGFAIFFVVPHMGFGVKPWILILSAFIGGLFAGFIVLLRETVLENIIMMAIVLVLAGILSGTKPDSGFVFISALLSGVIGTITNQINQYAANKTLKSGTPQSESP